MNTPQAAGLAQATMKAAGMLERKCKPPFAITLAIWQVLILTGWNATRLLTSLLWREALERYAPWPGHLYIGASGGLWTLTGILLLWGFWRRARRIRLAWLSASAAYALWLWADRLFVQAERRADWPFDLALTGLLLGFLWTVALLPRYRTYFEREAHERESKDTSVA